MLSYIHRSVDPTLPPILRELYKIMEGKKSNLCIAADVLTSTDLIRLIHAVGPYICILKTHIDILTDFTPSLTDTLTELSKTYNFLLFEDRKFADIGNTVVHQYRDGIYHISSWAHIINCHPLPGPGVVKGLAQVGLGLGNRGCLLISDMSSEGWLGNEQYKRNCLDIAHQYANFVIGWISGSKWKEDLPGIVMTPGVSIETLNDALGQQYKTPEKAILENGSDVIIVGRSILNAEDPSSVAQQYQKAGWEAYEKRLSYLNL